MATSAPITGASTGARISDDTLSGLETLHGHFDCLRAIIQASENEAGPGGMSMDGLRILSGAIVLGGAIDAEFRTLIDRGYREQREGC